jgi:hypothetical protein
MFTSLHIPKDEMLAGMGILKIKMPIITDFTRFGS